MRAPFPTSVVLTACLLLPQLASAQPDPPIGVRAAGMGGAFVAVADDASAVYWNPGGLAAAAYFSIVVDRNTVSTADDATAPRDGSGLLFALGTPPLGLTYYRTSRTEMIDIGPTMARVQRLVTNQAGATLVQSIGGVVAIGATLKFVRGNASAATVPSGAELDVVDGAVDRGSNAFDADVGVMVTHNAFKAGVAVRNLFEPSFELADGSGAIPLERRIRAGVSWRLERISAAGRRQRPHDRGDRQYPMAGRRRRRRDPCARRRARPSGRHPLEHGRRQPRVRPGGECGRQLSRLPLDPGGRTGQLRIPKR